MKRVTGILLALLLVSCGDSPDPVGPLDAGTEVVTGKSDNPSGRYIVTLKRGANASSVAQSHGLSPAFTYSHVLNGFAAQIPEAARAALQKNPNVERIEEDMEVRAIGSVQTGATWGLDRVDQRGSSLDGSYGYDFTGAGVTSYIVDTGIRYSHNDFGGRAEFGYDAFGGDGSDCHGHGTHVAGTVGSATYGIAKNTRLVAVRVLNCSGSGTVSGVVAGLDWAAAQNDLPAVLNMSLGGGASATLDEAVRRTVAAGITVVVAAGNSNADACTASPARAPDALTIGATESGDARASFSNWGSCVDLFAPGRSIKSTYYTSDDATASMSGTSMASPHVAGAAALILQESPGASPASVASTIMERSTRDVVSGANSANDHLLYTLAGGASEPPANQAHNAAFSADCTGLTCSFTDGSSDVDGSIAGWSWSFGDGTTSGSRNPEHSFGGGGSYTVQLTVTDDDGATASTSKSVTVESAPANAAPSAAFSVSCDGLSCSFTDQSSDSDGSIAGREWSFGDGSGSTVQNPAHDYTADGTYTVTLTVTDDDGATADASQDVTVQAPVNAAPTAKFRVRCDHLECSFTDQSRDSDGSIAKWAWDFGDGSTSPDASPRYSYADGGTFTVTLTVTDDDGATADASQSVTVQAPPNAAPSADFTASCDGLACTFADQSSDPDGSIVQWSWDFGDGSSNTTEDAQPSGVSHTYASDGSYEVRLTVTDDAGDTSTATALVTVGAQPMTLEVEAYKEKGQHRVQLTWTGARTADVDIFVNGAVHATVADSGGYLFANGERGQGSYTFQVCETGDGLCSPEKTVSF